MGSLRNMFTSVASLVGGNVIRSKRKVAHRNLLLTNCLFSTAMGAVGDIVQQRYDILTSKEPKCWKPVRTSHMAAAGLTTGALTHYWYFLADILFPGRTFLAIFKKILCDQILFSPVCITVYFGTVSVLEGSMETLKEELYQKGSKIYIMEWLIWPPVQFINFYLLPMKFRVIFDNLVSFGFDVYSPYVKYNYELKCDNKENKDL